MDKKKFSKEAKKIVEKLLKDKGIKIELTNLIYSDYISIGNRRRKAIVFYKEINYRFLFKNRIRKEEIVVIRESIFRHESLQFNNMALEDKCWVEKFFYKEFEKKELKEEKEEYEKLKKRGLEREKIRSKDRESIINNIIKNDQKR